MSVEFLEDLTNKIITNRRVIPFKIDKSIFLSFS